MIKASALYIVIVIALVIGLICSALVLTAYFYQSTYQAKFRADKLQNNITSGINILLTSKDITYRQSRFIDLFAKGTDSLSLQRLPWGVFDVGVVYAFIQRDTMYRVFTMGNKIDSSKWAALYLIDEDRPLSFSGKTMVRGDAYIPKAGVKTAYVDNQSYTGEKKIIQGRTHDSQRALPSLTASRLLSLRQLWHQTPGQDNSLLKNTLTDRSFRLSTITLGLGKQVSTLQNINLNGNIIIYSDTTLVIDSTAHLHNIIVFARAISVRSGFQGNCQLYATDSISVERDCHLEYPSCLGIFRDTSGVVAFPEKISLGENTKFSGQIFTYEKTIPPLLPIITLGKNVVVAGQIYSQGNLSLKTGVIINGSAMTNRFLYQSQLTSYENYLMNATIDARGLSPYYLTSELSPVARAQKMILQWLEIK